MILNLIDRNKIRADNFIILLLLLMYTLWPLFFIVTAVVSIIVYPLVALILRGILMIVISLRKKRHGNSVNLNKILLGIIYIMFGGFFINYILIQPKVTSKIIITLFAFPMVVVGMAGIIKGVIVDIYSTKYRILNILIGIVTVIISFMAIDSPGEPFIMYILTLSSILLINLLSRAALYLSEYGLSLIHFKNFKLFFYIISDYILNIDIDGNIELRKIG